MLNQPKMPSPFDRSKLKEQIKIKRTCSPIDLSTMPKECDQLLNLRPIVHRQQKEIPNEEIDCGDLFGSMYSDTLIKTNNFNLRLISSWFNIRYNMYICTTRCYNTNQSSTKSFRR